MSYDIAQTTWDACQFILDAVIVFTLIAVGILPRTKKKE